jgi:two-component system, LytTR family, sensor kinase
LLQVRDKWFRFLIILLPSVVVLYTNGLLLGIDKIKLLRVLISVCCIVLICEGSRYLIYNSRRWLSGGLRILITIFAGLLWVTLLLGFATLQRKFVATGTWDGSVMMDSNIIINDHKLIIGLWGYALLNAVFIFPVLLVAYEIIYHYAQLRYVAREKEKLEKEKLKAELQQLKGIVNPHFLFNNLNSLSSLIIENPENAQNFLDELTKVFRYLLRNNETDLTTLSQELDFIKSYYNLLQTRYGKAIRMDIQIDPAHEDLLIPPLTLQLLVENAVKHNRLQKENPLHIELVITPGNKLAVRNNLLKREGLVESTGIGLQNINARYRMLKQPGVVIEKDDHYFAAIISLIEPEDWQ